VKELWKRGVLSGGKVASSRRQGGGGRGGGVQKQAQGVKGGSGGKLENFGENTGRNKWTLKTWGLSQKLNGEK